MFIAIDGEGETREDGRHYYTLLASSERQCVQSSTGLSFYECANFLFRTKRDFPKAKFIGYSLNYDINMLLGDIPTACMMELWEDGKTSWHYHGAKWYVEWVPSKIFTIRRYQGASKDSVKVWDVFGFFQMSFVRALIDWKITGLATIAHIEKMKRKRGEFVNVDSSAILDYCYAECNLLVRLMETLDDAFKKCGIHLRSYHGAGAAATALFEREHVKQHHQYPPPNMVPILLSAYYGGRTEIFELGEVGTVYNADINSAYPYASTKLPCLIGEWYESTRYEPSEPYAVWYVEWNISGELAPFPYRLHGSIMYSSNGCGWYHGIEVATALRLYPRGEISVKHGYVYRPTDTDCRPFQFVSGVYEERRRRKAAGDSSEKPLKLSINSLYGKTAQGFGHKDKAPPYQSYLWAGFITAHTRAQILEAVYPIRNELVGIATDGIFSKVPIPNLTQGKGLGEWETKQYDDFFSAQPGVYAATMAGAKIQRNRGFSTRELDFDRLRDAYRVSGIGARVSFNVTRFVGYGSIAKGRKWRTWAPATRVLGINAGNKLPGNGTRLYLGTVTDGVPSEPYKPKMTWTDFDGANDVIDGEIE